MNINGQNIFLKGVRNEHIPQEPEDYPFTLPVVRNLTTLEFNKSVTYIVGENGSGKSTLLEAIATILNLNPEGGSRNFNFRTWETHSRLYEDLRPIRADLGYRFSSVPRVSIMWLLKWTDFRVKTVECLTVMVEGACMNSLTGRVSSLWS